MVISTMSYTLPAHTHIHTRTRKIKTHPQPRCVTKKMYAYIHATSHTALNDTRTVVVSYTQTIPHSKHTYTGNVHIRMHANTQAGV